MIELGECRNADVMRRQGSDPIEYGKRNQASVSSWAVSHCRA